ncbi:MAG: hypothetical protein R3D85_13265 [Paracoccaceae bacterium]
MGFAVTVVADAPGARR